MQSTLSRQLTHVVAIAVIIIAVLFVVVILLVVIALIPVIVDLDNVADLRLVVVHVL